MDWCGGTGFEGGSARRTPFLGGLDDVTSDHEKAIRNARRSPKFRSPLKNEDLYHAINQQQYTDRYE